MAGLYVLDDGNSMNSTTYKIGIYRKKWLISSKLSLNLPLARKTCDPLFGSHLLPPLRRSLQNLRKKEHEITTGPKVDRAKHSRFNQSSTIAKEALEVIDMLELQNFDLICKTS
jgi:hypothetical protein